MALVKCSECGKGVSNQADRCPNCGHILRKKQSVFGIIGFILSIIGLFLGIEEGAILSIVSLIFCIIGCLEKDKKHGLAIAGNIISFIGLFFVLMLFSALA